MADEVLNEETISKLSFEEAMSKLEAIVRSMEACQIKLDEAIKYYELGNLLRKHCEQKLANAKSKIDEITVSMNGQVSGFKPFDMEQ
ncbi:MAG: exodeoxyribonuclease VII small subunit [Alphaproteobacteria bacterium]|nr:exodeoxyribonuclease VII small subunit [Alphaproteobacteria bacterium]